jgi:hypothetical protein
MHLPKRNMPPETVSSGMLGFLFRVDNASRYQVMARNVLRTGWPG